MEKLTTCDGTLVLIFGYNWMPVLSYNFVQMIITDNTDLQVSPFILIDADVGCLVTERALFHHF